MGLNRTALLVCFTWLLKPMIDLNLTRRLLLLQVEQIYKMTTFFAQNGHRYHFQLKELSFFKFSQLITTVNFFSALDKACDSTAK